MKYFIIFLIFFAASSCTEKLVRDNPREQYRQCLKDNPEDQEKCDVYRESYQQRLDSYKDVYHQGAGSSDY